MPGVTIVIHPNGTRTAEKHKSLPNLEFMQAKVGGPIEIVPYFTKYGGEPCVAFCNEEGKLPHMALTPNITATEIWHRQGYEMDYLVGDILIVQGDKAFMAAL
jgi:hypothetical protein